MGVCSTVYKKIMHVVWIDWRSTEGIQPMEHDFCFPLPAVAQWVALRKGQGNHYLKAEIIPMYIQAVGLL